MGITKRVTSDRHSERTLRQMQELVDAWSPWIVNRRHLVEVLTEKAHLFTFDILLKGKLTAKMLGQFAESLQGLHRTTSSYRFPLPSQAAGDGALKIGPKRVDSLGGNQAERPKISITRRWAGAKESEARFFSFESPNFLRPVFAWRIAQ